MSIVLIKKYTNSFNFKKHTAGPIRVIKINWHGLGSQNLENGFTDFNFILFCPP